MTKQQIETRILVVLYFVRCGRMETEDAFAELKELYRQADKAE